MQFQKLLNNSKECRKEKSKKYKEHYGEHKYQNDNLKPKHQELD